MWDLNELDQDLEKAFEQLEEKYKHVQKEEEQKERYITVYEGMVKLTGKFNKAVMLQGLISWHKTVERMDAEAYKEALEAKMAGDVAGAYQALRRIRNGWFWKTEKEMSEELMGAISPATCGRYFDEFIERGFLEVRKNTKNKTDHRNYYRVNIEKIRMELAKLGYNLDGYKFYVGKNHEGQTRKGNVRSLPQNEVTGKSSTLTDITPEEPLKNLIPQNEVTSPQNEVSAPQNEASNTYIYTGIKNTTLKTQIDKQQQIQSGQAAEKDVVVVEYQQLIESLFGKTLKETEIQTLMKLAKKHGKDLAQCIKDAKDYIVLKKESATNLMGLLRYSIETGFDLESLKEEVQVSTEEDKLPFAIRMAQSGQPVQREVDLLKKEQLKQKIMNLTKTRLIP